MGPLKGTTIIEFDGVGPAPFACMLLSDMGADVIRIERTNLKTLEMDFRDTKFDIIRRGRRSIAVDIRSDQGAEICLRLIENADVVVEGFRPGVMERLNLGPDACLQRNPKLVYGRMTGWGQEGPLSATAGHDINYIALTGALTSIGAPDKPIPPLNLIGDYGGALYLNLGILAAVIEARQSGRGQVVDAAMTDASASLMALYYGMQAAGFWNPQRGSNMLDGGAHFYNAYETSDGKWIALGSVEPQFYSLLREKLGLDDDAYDAQMSPAAWPELKEKLAVIFKQKTRDEWCAMLETSDVCFAPILELEEAHTHAHNQARQTFVEYDGIVQPNIAPRFSRTESQIQCPPPVRGAHTAQILKDAGFSEGEIEGFSSDNIISIADEAAY